MKLNRCQFFERRVLYEFYLATGGNGGGGGRRGIYVMDVLSHDEETNRCRIKPNSGLYILIDLRGENRRN